MWNADALAQALETEFGHILHANESDAWQKAARGIIYKLSPRRPIRSVYLAARYSRREEMKRIRDTLHSNFDITVTSRWIDFADMPTNFEWYDPDLHGSDDSAHAAPAYRSDIAVCDVEDTLAADAIILFTPGGTRGGCFVEYGVAVASRKRLFVCGPRINVFHNLPQAEVHPTISDIYAVLEAEAALV